MSTAQPACIDPLLVHNAERAVRRLRKSKKTIVTAESCTAGLLAAVLSNVDGAGEVLHGGFVTYSKPGKSMMIGVPADLLDEKGSVNNTVAIAMAEGALARAPADLALAVTGVLGPEPDEDGNPVGLVILACAVRGAATKTLRHNFGALPHDVLRRRTVLAALDLIAECL